MFTTHRLCTRSCARTCWGWGRPGAFSPCPRLALLVTVALHPNGLDPDLPLTLEVHSALSNPSTKVGIYPKIN